MQSRIERFPPVFCTVLFLLFDLAITCDDTQKHLTRLLTLLYTTRSERPADVDVAASVTGEKVRELCRERRTDGVKEEVCYRDVSNIKILVFNLYSLA